METRVIVIGAGWTGLAAAKTYLEVRPDVSLTIIDEDDSVGGVWSASRVYPGFIADSTAAIFDYSDFPMDAELGVDKWADLPAERVHAYLERYVDKFDLRRRCRLGTKVVRIEKSEGAKEQTTMWKVEVEAKSGDGEAVKESLACDKLIMATGINSTPNLPSDIDWSTFDGPILHSKDVGTKHHLLTSESVRRVTVVGGNKSAVDVVNMCALAGKEVDWVIRKEGYGPGILFGARTHGIHIGAIEAIRASSIPSPNILSSTGFWYWFLHSGKSKIGSRFQRWLMAKLSESALKEYEKSENTMKIAPDMKNIFWSNSGLSVVHDGSNFMDMVKECKLIHIHRSSVSALAHHTVELSDGQVLPCDAAVFATGWKTNQISVFDCSTTQDIGFPLPLEQEPLDQAKHWDTVDRKSNLQIKALFPMLAHPPPDVVEYDEKHSHPASTTPFRLFRSIAPPKLAARGDRSLIVLGIVVNTRVPVLAEVSSLWGIAYLENLPFSPDTSRLLSDLHEMEENISLLESWRLLRFRDISAVHLDGSEIIQDIIDLLMKDLGLRLDRKRLDAERKGIWGLFGWGAWVREWFSPYRGSDYRGLVEEYKRTWGLQWRRD